MSEAKKSNSKSKIISLSKKNSKTLTITEDDQNTVFLNPQRKRLEQLHQRRKVQEEHQKCQKEKEKHHKTKMKDSHAIKSLLPKASAEIEDGESREEYSAEETDEEALRGIKNENLRVLMIEKNKLRKAMKLVTDNDKKLKILQEVSNKWFDKYDEIVNGIEEQMNVYDASREVVLHQILQDVKPLCDRWAENRKLLKKIKLYNDHSMFSISNQLAMEKFLHYIVSFLRTILFAVAYCRDAIFSERKQKSTPDVNLFQESPVL